MSKYVKIHLGPLWRRRYKWRRYGEDVISEQSNKILLASSCKTRICSLLLVVAWVRLKWFLSIALRIPTVHDFPVISACSWRLHVHNVRDFPQAKLDSKINACFPSNKHADLYFLLHEFGVKIILFKKNCSEGKVHKSITRGYRL